MGPGNVVSLTLTSPPVAVEIRHCAVSSAQTHGRRSLWGGEGTLGESWLFAKGCLGWTSWLGGTGLAVSWLWAGCRSERVGRKLWYDEVFFKLLDACELIGSSEPPQEVLRLFSQKGGLGEVGYIQVHRVICWPVACPRPLSWMVIFHVCSKGWAMEWLGDSWIRRALLLQDFSEPIKRLLCCCYATLLPLTFSYIFPSVSWDQDRLWGVACRVVSRDAVFSWHVLALSQILWGSPPVH